MKWQSSGSITWETRGWRNKTVWLIRCWCNETLLLRDLLVPLLQCYSAQGCSEMSKYQRFATLKLYNITRTSLNASLFLPPRFWCINIIPHPCKTQNCRLKSPDQDHDLSLCCNWRVRVSLSLWWFKHVFIWFVLCVARKGFLGKAHLAFLSEYSQIWAWFFWSSLV